MIDSAALTLYTLFALVPLLALVLLILGKFGVYDRVVEIIYDSAPQDWYAMLDTIVGAATTAAGNIAPGFFAVVGIATLLFAVFTLFRTAEESFNRVWGISKSRGFIVRYVAYIVVAIVVPVLALGAIILASDILSMLGLEHEMNRAISILLSLALATLACSLVYKFLPYTRVQWRMALIAGLFAGMGLSLWHWGYVYFQSMMTSYNVIYGGLAFIPLFILWLQVSWNILLTGCEVCCVLQHRSHFERIDRRRLKRREEDVLLKNDRSVRVVIVGSVNVAEALARTLQSVAGVELVQIFARNR
jgi:membrane protein